jgi:hypothetical protein
MTLNLVIGDRRDFIYARSLDKQLQHQPEE